MQETKLYIITLLTKYVGRDRRLIQPNIDIGDSPDADKYRGYSYFETTSQPVFCTFNEQLAKKKFASMVEYQNRTIYTECTEDEAITIKDSSGNIITEAWMVLEHKLQYLITEISDLSFFFSGWDPEGWMMNEYDDDTVKKSRVRVGGTDVL